MDIMWFQCGHNVVTTWTPHGFQVETIWFLCRYHVVSMCKPCGFQMDTMWFLNLFQLISVRMANLIHILGTEYSKTQLR